MVPSFIPSFYFYKFAQGISQPYTSFEAYRAGIIDAHGNLRKPESSIDPLEYLIIKLKKIFEELPPGVTKSKLDNYLSTLQVFGEEVTYQLGLSDEEYAGLVEAELVSKGYVDINYLELYEDMASGGMATAGTSSGYNQGGVSGTDPVMGMERRTKPVLTGLDNCTMFDVCPKDMNTFKQAKSWNDIEDSESSRYIKRFSQRNNGRIVLRSVNPDSGEQDLYWINYPSKTFTEQFDLDKTKISLLNEEEVIPLWEIYK